MMYRARNRKRPEAIRYVPIIAPLVGDGMLRQTSV